MTLLETTGAEARASGPGAGVPGPATPRSGRGIVALAARVSARRRSAWLPELRAALILTFVVVTASTLLGHQPDAWLQHLGAENFRIARALVDGRGFSDPFGEPTGPTAWVPPLYPALLAALLLVLKTKSAVAMVIVAITNATLILSGTVLYALVRRSCVRLPAWPAVALYASWLLAHFYYLFMVTHDIWLHQLLCTAMVVLVHRYVVLRRFNPWLWGGVGGLATLANPTLTFAWCSLFVLFFVQQRSERRRWALATAVVLVMAAPWAVRNALVFQRFVPVKSNMGYELYQANVTDDDGVYTDETFREHPYIDRKVRAAVTREGELGFIAARQRLFFEYLARSPGDYARKMGQRLLAATLRSVPANALEAQGAGARARRFLHPLPAVLLLAALLVRGPHRRLLGVLAWFYIAYLSVYVVAAYYARYLLPITPVLMLFVLVGADHLLVAWRTRQRLVSAA
jgi:hypothetical protein